MAAFGQGARSLVVAPPAVETLRRQFIPQISSALRSLGWREDWQRERVYVVAYAEALGQRAKALAAEDRRAVIMPQDVDTATIKLRGYMPIAARWCPL